MIEEQTHIVGSYERELALLKSSVIEMGKIVRDILIIANDAIQNPKMQYVDIVSQTDKSINQLDDSIEKRAISLIALRQPMAIDLRVIITSLRLAVMMERMGDLAKNAVKKTADIKTGVNQDILSKVDVMTKKIIIMFDGILTCFDTRDHKKAMKLCSHDDDVDNLYEQIISDIYAEMAQKPDNINDLMQILYAARNIERIGDYVTKFAKHLYYIVTGEKARKNTYKN